jgi:AraC-like DNA-binding protein
MTMVTAVGKKGFSDSVRRAIVPLLADGHPQIARTAEAVGCSVRTLQRRIARDGLTYRRIVGKVRFQEAHRLLRDTRLRLIDITDQLGFTDAGSFSRSFARWSGVPPRVYRRRMLEGRGARSRAARASDLGRPPT